MANTAAYSGLRCEDDAGLPCVVGKGHVRTPDGDSDQEMGVVVGCPHVQFALEGPPVALSLPTAPVGRQFGEEQCQVPWPVGESGDGVGLQARGADADSGSDGRVRL